MTSALDQRPVIQAQRSWWLPFVSLLATVYGILFQGWGMQAVVVMFWWEIILIVAAGLVRALFALDGKPVLATLGTKLVVLPFGAFMGGAAIMLAVVFSIEGMSAADDGSLADVSFQGELLLASYVLGIVLHFFLNGRFRTASPIAEMALPMMHLVVLLSLLMPITMHLLPAYPHLDKARHVALAVIAVKFLADMLINRSQKHLQEFVLE